MKTVDSERENDEFTTVEHFVHVEDHLPVLDVQLKAFGLEIEVLANEGGTFTSYRIVRRTD